jgi:hypothetical protein
MVADHQSSRHKTAIKMTYERAGAYAMLSVVAAWVQAGGRTVGISNILVPLGHDP